MVKAKMKQKRSKIDEKESRLRVFSFRAENYPPQATESEVGYPPSRGIRRKRNSTTGGTKYRNTTGNIRYQVHTVPLEEKRKSGRYRKARKGTRVLRYVGRGQHLQIYHDRRQDIRRRIQEVHDVGIFAEIDRRIQSGRYAYKRGSQGNEETRTDGRKKYLERLYFIQ